MGDLGLKNVYFLAGLEPLEPPKLDFYKCWELSGSKLLIFIMFEGSGDLKRLLLQGLEPLELQKLDFYNCWELSGSKLFIFIMFGGSGDLKYLFLQTLGMVRCFFAPGYWFY